MLYLNVCRTKSLATFVFFKVFSCIILFDQNATQLENKRYCINAAL